MLFRSKKESEAALDVRTGCSFTEPRCELTEVCSLMPFRNRQMRSVVNVSHFRFGFYDSIFTQLLGDLRFGVSAARPRKGVLPRLGEKPHAGNT